MPQLATATDAEIDRYVMLELRKIQAEGFKMPGIATATDAENDRFVMSNLSRIQAEGFDMPRSSNRERWEINHFVMGNLRAIRTDALDELTDGGCADDEADYLKHAMLSPRNGQNTT